MAKSTTSGMWSDGTVLSLGGCTGPLSVTTVARRTSMRGPVCVSANAR